MGEPARRRPSQAGGRSAGGGVSAVEVHIEGPPNDGRAVAPSAMCESSRRDYPASAVVVVGDRRLPERGGVPIAYWIPRPSCILEDRPDRDRVARKIRRTGLLEERGERRHRGRGEARAAHERPVR